MPGFASAGGWSSAALSRAGALAEIWYLASQHQFAAVDASEPFQPAVVPFYLGLIASIYLIAAVATDSRRPVRVRPALLAAADNSYGIYLCNAVFLIGLSALGYGDLAKQLPWPLAVGYAVGAVYLASTALTVLLRRLPGAWVTVGAARRTIGPPLVHVLVNRIGGRADQPIDQLIDRRVNALRGGRFVSAVRRDRAEETRGKS